MKHWFLAPMALVLLLAQSSLAASVDYKIHWRTLRTPHFEIIYDRDHKDVAENYAVAAEQAYEVLCTRFSEQPSKTTIVLNDRTDQANGMATFLPYTMIQIYPVLPDSLTTLDYYGDWPVEMVMHEYTHINAFTPVHGWLKPFNYIFGSIAHPTGLLPRWWHEGLAVESETRFTTFGRLKSPRLSAELRAMAQDGTLKRETIDRINETILPEFPYGDRPYLLGSILWEHMLQNGPPDLVETLTQRYSRRLPWLINGPVKDLFGVNYAQLLEQTYNEVEKNTFAQIDLIQAQHKESYQLFPDLDMEAFQPSISPDGDHLIFLTGSLRRFQIRMINRTGSESFRGLKSERVANVLAATRLSWFPDSQSFVYDSIDESDPYHDYRELFRYDIKTGETTRLTKNLRAQDPSVSPDGQKIVFVGNKPGQHWLGLLDLAHHSTKTLFHPGLSIRLNHPEFIANDQIAFTGRNTQGQERLYVYNLNDGKMKTVVSRKTELRRPTKTPYGLLVADTSSGVENIAVVDVDQQTIQPITNTTTDMQSADYDSRTKELIGVRYTGHGRRLITTAPTNDILPTIGSVVPAKWPTPPTLVKIDKSEIQEESYQPWEYMYPRYWMPFLYPVYNGVFMQAITSVADPAGINSYNASLSYDTVTGRPSYSFQYTNASLPPDIDLSYIREQSYLSASGFVLDEQTAQGDFSFFLPGMGRHWKMLTGYMLDHIDSPLGSQNLNRQGPVVTLSYNNWNDSFAEGAGTSLQLTQEQFLHGPNQAAYGRSYASFTQAWKKWLPQTHRIVLTGRGMLAPNLPVSDILSLGDGSLGANYLVPLTNSPFLFRGYGNGTFVGRRVINWNLEYQFPLMTEATGWGTLPVFFRGMDGAVVFDGIGVDGYGYDHKDDLYHSRKLGNIALSTGFEARLNTTLAYQLPVTWIVGLYEGFDKTAGQGLSVFLGLAFSDLSAIDQMRQKVSHGAH